MKDVYNPDYYKTGKIEVADFIEDKDFNFFLGNVVKYVSRAGKKEGNTAIQDLKKAQWYLNKEISRLGGEEPAKKCCCGEMSADEYAYMLAEISMNSYDEEEDNWCEYTESDFNWTEGNDYDEEEEELDKIFRCKNDKNIDRLIELLANDEIYAGLKRRVLDDKKS